MKERPIIFSTPMVQAIMDGQKTMTRRILKPQPEGNPCGICYSSFHSKDIDGYGFSFDEKITSIIKCPYGQPGDRLWVRETFIYAGNQIIFKADEDPENKLFCKWSSPLFMPKSAARLWLEIEEVRVETLHDISESDAISEGFASRDKFAAYWESLHGDFSYLEDPWVWVIKFRRVEK